MHMVAVAVVNEVEADTREAAAEGQDVAEAGSKRAAILRQLEIEHGRRRIKTEHAREGMIRRSQGALRRHRFH